MQPAAVFFDRDGTLIVEREYLSLPEQVELLSGAAEAIRLLNERGIPAIVITNQSGVAWGYFDEAAVAAAHARLNELLGAAGAKIDAFYYCPHHPEGKVEAYRQICECRKPAAGLLKQAAADFGIDLSRAVMIGDKLTDVDAAVAAGARAILVRTGYGRTEKERGGESLLQAMIEDDALAAVSRMVHSSD